MSKNFNLDQYLSNGVKELVASALKASIINPFQTAFLTGFAVSAKKAALKREKAAEAGFHIPPFLIASITSSCNLRCVGCYARENHSCGDDANVDDLSADEWQNIFLQAEKAGISFILLAGGEPLIRRDIIKKAASNKRTIFPVFTNGTLIDEDYIELFRKNRNIIPVLSLEGAAEATDLRRGLGVYEQVFEAMKNLEKNGIFFGTSLTVTKKNMHDITDDAFAQKLKSTGCSLAFYVEYVPVAGGDDGLELSDEERDMLEYRVNSLRTDISGMMFVSFPGDEKTTGGCLAAGRGFFHINSRGGAEPCPFSPFSDTNVLQTGLPGALESPLFTRIRDCGLLTQEHSGGCTLFALEDSVRALQ